MIIQQAAQKPVENFRKPNYEMVAFVNAGLSRSKIA